MEAGERGGPDRLGLPDHRCGGQAVDGEGGQFLPRAVEACGGGVVVKVGEVVLGEREHVAGGEFGVLGAQAEVELGAGLTGDGSGHLLGHLGKVLVGERDPKVVLAGFGEHGLNGARLAHPLLRFVGPERAIGALRFRDGGSSGHRLPHLRAQQVPDELGRVGTDLSLG